MQVIPRSDQEANKNNIGYMEFSLLKKGGLTADSRFYKVAAIAISLEQMDG